MEGRYVGIIVLLSVIAFASPIFGQDYLCANIQNEGLISIVDPHNCSTFYECFDGKIVGTGSCPNGYWFSSNAQTCVLESETICAAYPVNPNCTSGLVDYYPYPYDCSKYIECYHGVEEVHDCPEGLWFNSAQKRCVDYTISNCGIYTSSPPYTTPVDTCWGVLPGQIILKPYPGVCNSYYECAGVDLSIHNCPDNLWFSESRQLCDWPELVDCEWGDNPPPVDPGAGFNDPRCADGNTEYWPYPECNQFVECYQGLGYLFDCPAGLQFNSTSKRCTYPSNSDCGDGSTTLAPPNTDPNWTPDPLCPWPNYDRYLFPYSGDCRYFWECWYGEKTLFICPEDLWFNPTLLVCDYPYEAGCYWSKMQKENEVEKA